MKLAPNLTQIPKLQEKLYEQLEGTGWDEKLRFFLKSFEFEDILIQLHLEAARWTPPLKSVLRPLQACRAHEVRLIIVVPEPYSDPTLNTGLALEYTGMQEVPQFNAFRKSAKSEVTGDNLELWTIQGILLINASLTTRVMDPGKHIKLWKPIMHYLVDVLKRQEKLAWLFLGKSEFYDKVPKGHLRIMTEALPEEKDEKWDSKNCFTKINSYLVDNFGKGIIW